MNSAGILLVLAGTWVISQVFAGDALRRLNITPNAENPRSVDSTAPSDKDRGRNGNSIPLPPNVGRGT